MTTFAVAYTALGAPVHFTDVHKEAWPARGSPTRRRTCGPRLRFRGRRAVLDRPQDVPRLQETQKPGPVRLSRRRAVILHAQSGFRGKVIDLEDGEAPARLAARLFHQARLQPRAPGRWSMPRG